MCFVVVRVSHQNFIGKIQFGCVPMGNENMHRKRTPISHIKYYIVYHFLCLLAAVVVHCIVRRRRRCAWLFKRGVFSRLNLFSILLSFHAYAQHTSLEREPNVHLRESSYELFPFCRFNIPIIILLTFLL